MNLQLLIDDVQNSLATVVEFDTDNNYQALVVKLAEAISNKCANLTMVEVFQEFLAT